MFLEFLQLWSQYNLTAVLHSSEVFIFLADFLTKCWQSNYGQCKDYVIFSNAVHCFLYSVESAWRVVILGANCPVAMYTTRFKGTVGPLNVLWLEKYFSLFLSIYNHTQRIPRQLKIKNFIFGYMVLMHPSLKVATVAESVTKDGSAFQTRAPATGKARSPIVILRVISGDNSRLGRLPQEASKGEPRKTAEAGFRGDEINPRLMLGKLEPLACCDRTAFCE